MALSAGQARLAGKPSLSVLEAGGRYCPRLQTRALLLYLWVRVLSFIQRGPVPSCATSYKVWRHLASQAVWDSWPGLDSSTWMQMSYVSVLQLKDFMQAKEVKETFI